MMNEGRPVVNYDPDNDDYYTEIEPGKTKPTIAIICLFDALDAYEDIDIPQLYDLLNPDALSTLLISHNRKEVAGTLTLEYTAGDFHLTISCSDGTADIRLRTNDALEDPDDPF